MNPNAIQVFQQYPEAEFNLLIPVKAITEISPLHKVTINTVQISANPTDGDVYNEKSGGLALTKVALSKLMTAAGIQMLDSRPITPSACVRCREANAGREAPLQCGTCPCKDDVSWQVVLSVPEISGNFRRVTATKELRMEDMRADMTEKQYRKFLPFRSEHCESKALNRAVREALSIKPTYRAEELAKPFAVALVTPNFDDVDLKNAMIDQITGGSSLLYGAARLKSQALPAPEEPAIRRLIAEQGAKGAENTPGTHENGAFPDEKVQNEMPFGSETLDECHNCGAIIEPFDDPRTGHWSVDRILEYSQKNWGKPLCRRCIVQVMRGGAA